MFDLLKNPVCIASDTVPGMIADTSNKIFKNYRTVFDTVVYCVCTAYDTYDDAVCTHG